jgi:predicted secreted protein
MTRKNLNRAAFVATTFALSLAAGLAAGAAAPAGSPAVLSVTAVDADKAVSLHEGTQLQVRLAAQLGTGYSWHVGNGSIGNLKLETSTVESHATQPGGTDVQVLTFSAQRAGSGMLTLDYSQAWNGKQPPARTFSLSVTVTAR